MATLRVLNINCWDLPYSKDLSLRVPLICRMLEQNDREAHRHTPSGAPEALLPTLPTHDRGYDVIGMEEVFMEQDQNDFIKAAKKGGLPYSHYFRSGMGFPGIPRGGHPSGLLLLSRYPIKEALFHRYSLNGKPHKLLHWDWHIAKGVGLARIISPFGAMDVYLSHLVAAYTVTTEDRDEYFCDRVAQAYECAKFICSTRRAPLSLLLCDLNALPGSLPYRILTKIARMDDAFIKGNDFVCRETERIVQSDIIKRLKITHPHIDLSELLQGDREVGNAEKEKNSNFELETQMQTPVPAFTASSGLTLTKAFSAQETASPSTLSSTLPTILDIGGEEKTTSPSIGKKNWSYSASEELPSILEASHPPTSAAPQLLPSVALEWEDLNLDSRGDTCNLTVYADGEPRRVDYIFFSSRPPAEVPKGSTSFLRSPCRQTLTEEKTNLSSQTSHFHQTAAVGTETGKSRKMTPMAKMAKPFDTGFAAARQLHSLRAVSPFPSKKQAIAKRRLERLERLEAEKNEKQQFANTNVHAPLTTSTLSRRRTSSGIGHTNQEAGLNDELDESVEEDQDEESEESEEEEEEEDGTTVRPTNRKVCEAIKQQIFDTMGLNAYSVPEDNDGLSSLNDSTDSLELMAADPSTTSRARVTQISIPGASTASQFHRRPSSHIPDLDSLLDNSESLNCSTTSIGSTSGSRSKSRSRSGSVSGSNVHAIRSRSGSLSLQAFSAFSQANALFSEKSSSGTSTPGRGDSVLTASADLYATDMDIELELNTTFPRELGTPLLSSEVSLVSIGLDELSLVTEHEEGPRTRTNRNYLETNSPSGSGLSSSTIKKRNVLGSVVANEESLRMSSPGFICDGTPSTTSPTSQSELKSNRSLSLSSDTNNRSSFNNSSDRSTSPRRRSRKNRTNSVNPTNSTTDSNNPKYEITSINRFTHGFRDTCAEIGLVILNCFSRKTHLGDDVASELAALSVNNALEEGDSTAPLAFRSKCDHSHSHKGTHDTPRSRYTLENVLSAVKAGGAVAMSMGLSPTQILTFSARRMFSLYNEITMEPNHIGLRWVATGCDVVLNGYVYHHDDPRTLKMSTAARNKAMAPYQTATSPFERPTGAAADDYPTLGSFGTLHLSDHAGVVAFFSLLDPSRNAEESFALYDAELEADVEADVETEARTGMGMEMAGKQRIGEIDGKTRAMGSVVRKQLKVPLFSPTSAFASASARSPAKVLWPVEVRDLFTMDADQHSLLGEALLAVSVGVLSAIFRKSMHCYRLLWTIFVLTVLGILSVLGLFYIPTTLALVILPLSGVYCTGEFYCFAMFGNEEISALNAAWYSIALLNELSDVCSPENYAAHRLETCADEERDELKKQIDLLMFHAGVPPETISKVLSTHTHPKRNNSATKEAKTMPSSL